MPVIAKPATPGLWYDTATPLNAYLCEQLRALGAVGVGRYVPLPGNDSSHDVSASELETITARGLQVLLFQHVRMPGWVVRDGGATGLRAREYALSIGVPTGVHLFCDWEGPSTDETAEAITYLDAWADAVRPAYDAALYVGYEPVLSPDELYALPGFDRYASDAGHRAVSTRGVCYQQDGPEVVIAGVRFDRATVMSDRLGGLPTVVAGSSGRVVIC
jgi:hypothetical protein